MYVGLHVKYRLLFSYFHETCIFSTDLRKILEYQVSRKSVQWEPSCFMRTDRDDEGNNPFFAIMFQTRLKNRGILREFSARLRLVYVSFQQSVYTSFGVHPAFQSTCTGVHAGVWVGLDVLPFTSNLRTGWKWVVTFIPSLHYAPGK
jgi:hypothetical protein